MRGVLRQDESSSCRRSSTLIATRSWRPLRLIAIGPNRVPIDSVPTELRRWSEETEVADIQNFDVGVMPLPDNLWTRGKCGYKLLQYMACGRPIVASPVGANSQIVEDGNEGFLAETEGDWIRALDSLA